MAMTVSTASGLKAKVHIVVYHTRLWFDIVTQYVTIYKHVYRCAAIQFNTVHSIRV